METKKANVARTGMALALTPAQEDAHVFRPDRNQTMFSNSEAFAVAKQNFVKLVGQVEPVADRIAEEASNPRTALQKEVLLRKQRFSGANNSSSYIAKRNELKRWKVSNKEIAGPAGKRAFAVELERINKSGDDDDVKAQRRLELKEKMEAAGVKEEVRDVVKKAGRDPRVNCDFKDWDPATQAYFYFNRRTQQSIWVKPLILERLRMDAPEASDKFNLGFRRNYLIAIALMLGSQGSKLLKGGQPCSLFFAVFLVH